MNKYLGIFILLNSLCFGQTSEKDLVKQTVENLFTGMKNADAEMIKSTFSEAPIMQSITKDGVLKNENIGDFITSISQLSKNDADERITFEAIHIDGNLASVFTPYEFYFKGKFSHCGANSFQLVKQNNIWKIQYLIDTRRKDCEK
ncbi:MAG: hypothetical protein K0R77_2568 [Chryseobacterium sp.]|jgi:hypothetical protein|uniref:nuclear transport factor 2 family protein n=1 Tax=Chryseobacterium sp. TaxID=1871047 RepID=UPI002615A16B|nr:nuclear transport factor 2 family protein [Chryseobacterium sp.]MDF2553293.1 hypothetical protein [Chryseobacterium sp.]